ncbi:hypothetical protein LTS08_007707 [Lithohypha guttulata]|uniref:SMP-30/Gluconolactonase/LRE-like region domain-containing protein n=1 Tax=Lithohypha guttulata TaxID=1690604 RepID=A0AAN7PJU8_9EURO|nr:hypothetical protein LTR51_008500 [Lithohypha guttulata]KAK5080407.1 hypothetical protein LTR05_008656 [Lithohypha guttulata]KAK5096451.1 hypothetical protein LTS08_007707 [Lithohypha guttulata]
MQLTNFLSAAALAATTFAQQYPIQPVYQFANSFSGLGYVNIENVAVRSTNNQLLLNFATGAIMAQINPDAANPQPEVLVNISSLYQGAPGSLTGIAEVSKDVYIVGAGRFQFGPQVPGGVAGVPGSFQIWSVDLNGPRAVANQVVAIPEANLLNGVAAVPTAPGVVLVADSALGSIFRVDTHAKTYERILSLDVFLPGGGNNFGINGIHLQGGNLYFTNSAQGIFGRVPFGPRGYPGGPAVRIASAPNGTYFDDFALTKNGDAYIATQENAISYVAAGSSQAQIIAGGGNSTTLAGPTSCVLRNGELFVVTAGVGGGPMGPVSGGVFKIAVGAAKKMAKRWFA